MGALFYKYNGDSILKHSVGSQASPVKTDLFDELVSEDYLTILTDITIHTNDVVQTFLSFDDFVHHYYFGKGVGQISVRGMCFMNCDGDAIPGLDQFYSRIGEKRGQEVVFSIGAFWFAGVLQDANVTIIAEPETHAMFSASFAMTTHNIVSPELPPPSC